MCGEGTKSGVIVHDSQERCKAAASMEMKIAEYDNGNAGKY
jgi:hypothetical protein